MKKILGVFLAGGLGSAVCTFRGEVAYAAGGAAPAADPVQHCLDLVQLNLARKIAPAFHVTSHPVQNPPKDLPIQCLAGNLNEIKSALRNQIANCQTKSAEEKAQAFQFGCRLVKNEDYCLNANTEMLKLANLANMNYTTFVNRAAREFDWYKSNGSQANEGNFRAGKPRLGQGCGVDEVTKLPIHWCIDNKNGTYSALPTREQIARGALDGKTQKIAYFRSLYDVSSFMLEGAGSVNLRQKDGSVENVLLNFAGTNGRPNNMIGDVLKCENKKIEGSFVTYYARHPDEAYRDTVHYNPSTVFYQRGVSYKGVDHISITPNASIATDPTSIPTGTVTLLNVPATSACGTTSSIAVAQDIGGRIKGAHIDRYTGAGPGAGTKANSSNNFGYVFMAVPKGAGSPVHDCVPKTAN